MLNQPRTDRPETWLRLGDDPGYDKHIEMLVGVFHQSDGERSDDRPLHDFLHMSWKQYRHYWSS